MFAALSKGTGVPVAEYTAAAKDAGRDRPARGRQGQRRGLPLPVDLRVPRQGDRGRSSSRSWSPRRSTSSRRPGSSEADYQKTLIVASIVEGEVSGVADRGKVARVIENRLENPTGPDRRPAADGLDGQLRAPEAGQPAPRPSTTPRSRSPYNTYTTRACRPARSAARAPRPIEAAANPTDGPWFYFVTVNYDTGETMFATTQAEHDRNNAAAPGVVRREQAEVRGRWLSRAGRRSSGRPVAHSLSPVLHTRGLPHAGPDRLVVCRARAGRGRAGRVGGRPRRRRWRGLSLTMPLKEAAFAVATTVTETARVTGAVNTLVRRRRRRLGRPQHRRPRARGGARPTSTTAARRPCSGAAPRRARPSLALGAARGAADPRSPCAATPDPRPLRLAVHAGIARGRRARWPSWGAAPPRRARGQHPAAGGGRGRCRGPLGRRKRPRAP